MATLLSLHHLGVIVLTIVLEYMKWYMYIYVLGLNCNCLYIFSYEDIVQNPSTMLEPFYTAQYLLELW